MEMRPVIAKVFYWIYTNITCVHFHPAPPVLVPHNGSDSQHYTTRSLPSDSHAHLTRVYCHIDGLLKRFCKPRHSYMYLPTASDVNCDIKLIFLQFVDGCEICNPFGRNSLVFSTVYLSINQLSDTKK